jgi:hypothetical protein
MPVLLASREPDHVARPNLLDRPAPPLYPAATRCDNEGLPEWMRMPRRPRARLETYAGSLNKIGRLKQPINSHVACEPV